MFTSHNRADIGKFSSRDNLSEQLMLFSIELNSKGPTKFICYKVNLTFFLVI